MKSIVARGISGAALITLSLLISSCGSSSGGSSRLSSVETNSQADTGIDEISLLSLENGTTNVHFTGDSDYLLIVNSSDQSNSDATVRLQGDISSALVANATSTLTALAAETPQAEEPEQSQFHQLLREAENGFSESDDYVPATPEDSTQAGLAANPNTKTFRVLSTMNSLTSYQEVTSSLRYTSDEIKVYVDNTNQAHISDAEIAEVVHNFEEVALPLERNDFGHEGDINSDGHITILMTCTVNRMATGGGIVTGFFFPGDMYQRSTVNPASNAQEIFYTLVPDPNGDCGVKVTNDFAVNNILPGVLAHEYQHMTSFYQHVFRNKGTTEEPWLNECLSHLAEDLTGFGNENPSRMRLFFSQPAQTAVVSPSAPTLAERGACYSFLRYLYEQSPDGDQFIRNLYSSSRVGVENLEEAYDEASDPDEDFDEFPEFLNRWTIALALSGTHLTSDSRYNYQERSTNADTQNLMGLCVRCNAQDNRGTVLDGPATISLTNYPSTSVVKPTASQFYRLQKPQGNLDLSITGGISTGALVKLAQ
jgi:hypothetical protein